MIKYKIFLLVFLIQFYSHCQKTNTIIELHATNFQTQVDGKTTNLYTLKNKKGMTVQITNYGARVVSLWVADRKGHFQDVVWGFETIGEYLTSSDIYCGPIVGRYGNRIDKGRFMLKDKQYQLTLNNNGNHLHGGTNGFYSKVWDAKPLIIEGNEALELTYFSKDGEEGYPGNLTIKVTYILTEDNSLKLQYSATTDKTTIINPTSHCYFNLSGTSRNTILEHVLFINAQKFTPTNEGLIPTGELRNLKGTPLDFTTPTAIGDRIDSNYEQLVFGKGYDHNFIINKPMGSYEKIATIYSPESGILMAVSSDQPGLQFYSGNFMKGNLKGKQGDDHNYRTGFALETQNFPDAPNHPNFPSAILEPKQTYTQTTSYTFGILNN
ncbi:MAG: galactose mutarotase [Bacteroidia bacterium]|nr:galactose mutarotase [Bacteroidia bacterium]